MVDFPIIRTAGEQGLVVEFGNDIDPEINDRVIQLYRRLLDRAFRGVIEAIPSYRSLLILFDPVQIKRGELKEVISQELAEATTSISTIGRQRIIPTVYGGEYGPDLHDVAKHAGLDLDEVVRIHAEGDYRVFMLGFTPGFPYLGGLDSRIATPRLASPRTQIPGGSVGIAGPQTGVYPIASPGGWRLIGRTPQVLFDPENDPPAWIQPGDRVRFEVIDEKQFKELSHRAVSFEQEEEFLNHEPVCQVQHPGFLTTVQDQGRWGYQHLGVPTAGAMDLRAFRLANWVIGNHENDPALEITLPGLSLIFLQDTCIAVTGGNLNPTLDGRPLPMWTGVFVRAGSVLRFTARTSGCRAYLAVGGGFAVKVKMGSAATYLRGPFGGFRGRALKEGDRLWSKEGHPGEVGWSVPEPFTAYLSDSSPLPVVLGPQDNAFTEEAIHKFLTSQYELSNQSDRMGSRFEGPALTHQESPDIISDGIPPGAVQVPGHGQPIVMTADRQTTGGYPKMAVMTRSGLDRLAQMVAGDRTSFQALRVEEAEETYIQTEMALRSWAESFYQTGIKKHWRMQVEGEVFDVIVQAKE